MKMESGEVLCLLFCAYSAWEFIVSAIWWAWNSIASCLSVVEQSSICVSNTARYGLGVFVNTLKHCTVMASTVGHQVAIVLQCPSRWATEPCWNHEHCCSVWSEAHCTGNIVITHTLQWTNISSMTCLVFGSIQKSSSRLSPSCIGRIVLWGFW